MVPPGEAKASKKKGSRSFFGLHRTNSSRSDADAAGAACSSNAGGAHSSSHSLRTIGLAGSSALTEQQEQYQQQEQRPVSTSQTGGREPAPSKRPDGLWASVSRAFQRCLPPRPAAPAERNFDCAICLEPVGSTGGSAAKLTCGHSYCGLCLAQHVTIRIDESRQPECPLCKKELKPKDFKRLGIVKPCRRGAAACSEAAPLDVNVIRALGLRCCPSCFAPIQKTGGCDNMRCRCGHAFKWSLAPLARPTPAAPAVRAGRQCGVAALGLVAVPLSGVIGISMTGAFLLFVSLRGLSWIGKECIDCVQLRQSSWKKLLRTGSALLLLIAGMVATIALPATMGSIAFWTAATVAGCAGSVSMMVTIKKLRKSPILSLGFGAVPLRSRQTWGHLLLPWSK